MALCCRLEGFKDPWETAVFKGRLVVPDKTLQDCGMISGSELITVRRVLVPEGIFLSHACRPEDSPLPPCCVLLTV